MGVSIQEGIIPCRSLRNEIEMNTCNPQRHLHATVLRVTLVQVTEGKTTSKKYGGVWNTGQVQSSSHKTCNSNTSSDIFWNSMHSFIKGH